MTTIPFWKLVRAMTAGALVALVLCVGTIKAADFLENSLPLPARPMPPRIVLAELTGYDAGCKICDGKWWKVGKNAFGQDAKRVMGTAADYCAVRKGVNVYIPGIGVRKVDDTGGRMREDWRKYGIVHFDVRFHTHREAKRYGVHWDLVPLM